MHPLGLIVCLGRGFHASHHGLFVGYQAIQTIPILELLLYKPLHGRNLSKAAAEGAAAKRAAAKQAAAVEAAAKRAAVETAETAAKKAAPMRAAEEAAAKRAAEEAAAKRAARSFSIRKEIFQTFRAVACALTIMNKSRAMSCCSLSNSSETAYNKL